MARLIDITKIQNYVEGRYYHLRDTKGMSDPVTDEVDAILHMIEDASIVDAVEVVRCKDCKYYRNGEFFEDIKFCYRLKGTDGKTIGYNFSEDDYCSYGERKEEP